MVEIYLVFLYIKKECIEDTVKIEFIKCKFGDQMGASCYRRTKYSRFIKNDNFCPQKSRLELERLFESSIHLKEDFVIIPTSESRFNYVVSTYFHIELWDYFHFSVNTVRLTLKNYNTILKKLTNSINISYPFTPLELQNLLFRCNYKPLGTTGDIYVYQLGYIPSIFLNKMKDNVIPATMVSVISKWIVEPFPYPIPELSSDRQNKFTKYLWLTYPTIHFSYVQNCGMTDEGVISFSLSNNMDFPELMALSEWYGENRVLYIEDTYKTLWSQDPQINRLYHAEIEKVPSLVPDLVNIIKEYFSPL